MKLIKMTLITSLAVGSMLTLSPALRADDGTSRAPAGGPVGGHHMRRGFERMAQALNLTDAQKPKVEAIMRSQMKKMRDVRQDSSLSREDRRAKMKTIHEDTATHLKAVLTSDQFAHWQKMVHRRMHRRMGPHSGNGKVNASVAAPKQI